MQQTFDLPFFEEIDLYLLSDSASCPDGFVSHRNSCYLFSHETARWADAVLSCQLFDSQLIEIEDSTENAYIKNVVKGLGGAAWYIGATDKAVEGEFVWMNSKQPLAQVFTDWMPGEPGNYNHDESCLALWKGNSYQWGDISCEDRYNYICETVGSGTVAPVVG